MSHWITQSLLPILAGTVLKKEGEKKRRNSKRGVEGKREEERGRYTDLQNYRLAMNKALQHITIKN